MLAKIGNIFYSALLVILVTIAGLVVISSFNFPGNYKLLVVQSGSMEPAIKKMSVVIVKPQDKYQINDIITVTDPTNPKLTITHRLVAATDSAFITKGDANKDVDLEKRPIKNVIGRVLFSIPFVGYLITFVKSREGLILMVIIPGTIIIYSELINIKNEALNLIKEKRTRRLNTKEQVEEKIGEEIIAVGKELKKKKKK